MSQQNIEKLLDRYFEGETSIEEERSLKMYFTSGNVAADLAEYTPLFAMLKQAGTLAAPAAPVIAKTEAKVLRFSAGWRVYMAGAVLVGLVVAGTLLFPTEPKFTDELAVTEVTDNTGDAIVTIPDETSITAPEARVNSAPKAKVKPVKKRHIKGGARFASQQKELDEAEARKAVEEIKAALALVSRKLNKGKKEAIKNIDKVNIAEELISKKES